MFRIEVDGPALSSPSPLYGAGESPQQYLIAARLRAAADRLIDTREPVTAIALGVGFNDISHSNASFRRTFGLSPSDLRRAI